MNFDDDPLIKALHRETEVTLNDLLTRKLFIEPAEQPTDWIGGNPNMLTYYADQGGLPKLDAIPAEAWFLLYADDLTAGERERLQASRRKNPSLVHAAALHVLAVTREGLTKAQRNLIFDRVRYVTAELYESGKITGSSNGGKADKKKYWAVDLANSLIEIGANFPSSWETIPEHTPEPLNEDVGIYRSDNGKIVVAVDLVTDKDIGSLTRSSFERHYFRKAKADTK
jgi:hypothetical protein